MYWGVSYGTIIGQLFAALHPERVSRLLLDGVVNPSEYLHKVDYAGITQSNDILTNFSHTA